MVGRPHDVLSSPSLGCKTGLIRGGITSDDALLSRGTTSDVYALGEDTVVKVPRPEVPDRWIDVEASHAMAVHEAGLPTPNVVDVIDVDDRRSIVFERVRGPSMLNELAASPQRADHLAREMAAIQREFHTAEAPVELPHQRGRVAGKIASSVPTSEQDRLEAARLLDGLPDGTSICHGDIHPGNILIGSDGPVVIDWFDAAGGHRLSDIVRSSLLVRPLASGESGPPHLPGVAAEVLARFHRSYIGAMLDSSALDVGTLLRWEAVLAVSRLAEPLRAEIDDLLAVWRARADLSLQPTTPLAELLLTQSEQRP